MNPDTSTWLSHNGDDRFPDEVSRWSTVSVLFDDGTYALAVGADEVDWCIVRCYDVLVPF